MSRFVFVLLLGVVVVGCEEQDPAASAVATESPQPPALRGLAFLTQGVEPEAALTAGIEAVLERAGGDYAAVGREYTRIRMDYEYGKALAASSNRAVIRNGDPEVLFSDDLLRAAIRYPELAGKSGPGYGNHPEYSEPTLVLSPGPVSAIDDRTFEMPVGVRMLSKDGGADFIVYVVQLARKVDGSWSATEVRTPLGGDHT